MLQDNPFRARLGIPVAEGLKAPPGRANGPPRVRDYFW
jgi:hypothetical protein